MVEAKLVRELDFPAQRVWAVLEDFGNMEWAMGPPKVEVLGTGEGMTRRILREGTGSLIAKRKSLAWRPRLG